MTVVLWSQDPAPSGPIKSSRDVRTTLRPQTELLGLVSRALLMPQVQKSKRTLRVQLTRIVTPMELRTLAKERNLLLLNACET
jgi:hypothetical protein